MTSRPLALASAALALGGMALGALLWIARWPALALETIIRFCG